MQVLLKVPALGAGGAQLGAVALRQHEALAADRVERRHAARRAAAAAAAARGHALVREAAGARRDVARQRVHVAAQPHVPHRAGAAVAAAGQARRGQASGGRASARARAARRGAAVQPRPPSGSPRLGGLGVAAAHHDRVAAAAAGRRRA